MMKSKAKINRKFTAICKKQLLASICLKRLFSKNLYKQCSKCTISQFGVGAVSSTMMKENKDKSVQKGMHNFFEKSKQETMSYVMSKST